MSECEHHPEEVARLEAEILRLEAEDSDPLLDLRYMAAVERLRQLGYDVIPAFLRGAAQ